MHSLAHDNTEDPVLTTAAAARLLGVAVSTTQLWLESGALPSWKTPGGHRRVRLSAVLKLLEDRARERQGGVRSGPLKSVPAPVAAVPVPAAAAPRPHPLPLDEPARLAAVEASGLIDSPSEDVFDRLTWLATQVTECPIALITVLGEHRQWFKSHIGVDFTETPRGWAFCNHAIVQDEPLMVEDAQSDTRFADNPLVTGSAGIRFYGGVTLRDGSGQPLGTLCVLDREPRRLRDRELKALEELATIASEELARRT
ncbi:GAF domain-containing protein [Herbaspirillum sp. SJZ107]|uniref:GAF domain-containing protein n=1 Tax=Herbaspirillum sp. SJZ107 TaxID=2572881 RepID=UPI0011518154|nr:GAF domain-containing protein [Herbaspirillum sp. SJZ107]TQK06794.1 excisionase family DNA binding protein [Herbaspirillum sp. SJZ107]